MMQHLTVWIISVFLIGAPGSCMGQIKEQSPKEWAIIPSGQPKLLKTQGSQSGDNVNSGLVDQEGKLWFGTTGEGVYRYDGKLFSQFTTAHGLMGNMVYCMLEDTDGRIWVGTDGGACLYEGGSFVEFPIVLPDSLAPTRYEVFNIIQDKGGKLWFATVNGLYVYDGKSFTPFVVNEAAGGFLSKRNNVEYILEDKAGNIWFGGRGNEGVFRYDGQAITHLKLKELDGQSWAWPVLQDKNGNIWFSNWGGAYRYDGTSFTIFTREDGLVTNVVTSIMEDSKGNLWFACGREEGGLCRYDGNAFACFTREDGLTNSSIRSILEDQYGYIWIGTRDTRLFRFDGESFTSFSEEELPMLFGK